MGRVRKPLNSRDNSPVFIWIVLLWCLPVLPEASHGQETGGYVIIDSRAGYSTNTVLNPFLGEWDRSSPTGYGFLSPMGHVYLNYNRLYTDVTVGGLYEPFLDGRQSMSGGFALSNLHYRFDNQFTASLATGGNRIHTTFNRRMTWLQPAISWSPSFYTKITAKAGSLFRTYPQDNSEPVRRSRFDLYALELETWRGFTWKYSAGLYGNLDQPAQDISLAASIEHLVSDQLRLSLRGGFDLYSYEYAINTGGGLPGAGGPGDFISETDHVFRLGLSGTYHVTSRVALLAGADHLRYYTGEESLADYHLSAGVRVTIQPRLNRNLTAEAQWQHNDMQAVNLRVNYRGDGQLYILGDFNDWEQPGVPLHRQDTSRYSARLDLPAGAYEYKILLIEDEEETWIEFTGETFTVQDGFGGENGLIFID